MPKYRNPLNESLRTLYQLIPVWPKKIRDTELKRISKSSRQVAWRFHVDAPIIEDNEDHKTFYAFTSVEAKRAWLKGVPV